MRFVKRICHSKTPAPTLVRAFISQHPIAEVSAELTRLSVQPRIHPAEAERIVTENILRHFESEISLVARNIW